MAGLIGWAAGRGGRPPAALAIGALSCALAWTCALAASQAPTRPEPPAVLSLRDAVEQALARNPTVLEAKAAADQARLSLRLAHAAFTPKVVPSMMGTLGAGDIANQSYGVSVSQKFQTGTELRANVGAISSVNQLGTYYYSDSTFLISQPLLKGFGRNATTAPLVDARARVADAGRQSSLAESQVALDVATAYFAVIVQERLVGVCGAALDRARSLRDASSARLATGKVSQLDVLRAAQLAEQADLQRLEAESSLADARDRLRVLIGRQDDDFAVDDHITVEEVEPVDAVRAVATALDHRAELDGARDALTNADRAVAAARGQLRPQVDLGLALTRRETSTTLGTAFGLDRFRVASFASLSMPIDRTSDTVALENAMLDRTRRQRDLDALRDRVGLEARQAVRRRDRAARALAGVRASLELATKEVDVATFRFQRGLSNNLDLVSAHATLRSAESQEIAATAELALANLSLRAALGLLNPRLDIK